MYVPVYLFSKTIDLRFLCKPNDEPYRENNYKNSKTYRLPKNLQGTGVTNFSGSVATSRLRSSFLPTPGAPISTIGRTKPGLG